MLKLLELLPTPTPETCTKCLCEVGREELHTWVQVWYLHMKTHPSFHQSGHLQGRDSSWPEAADGLPQGPWAACLFCPQECEAFSLGALLPC